MTANSVWPSIDGRDWPATSESRSHRRWLGHGADVSRRSSTGQKQLS